MKKLKLMLVCAIAVITAMTMAGCGNDNNSGGNNNNSIKWQANMTKGTVGTGADTDVFSGGTLTNGILITDVSQYTKFGGYSSEFNDGFTENVGIYLDPAAIPAEDWFAWSGGINDPQGNQLGEAIVFVRNTPQGLKIGAQGWGGYIQTIQNNPTVTYQNYGSSDAASIIATGDNVASLATNPAFAAPEYQAWLATYQDTSYTIPSAGWYTISIKYFADSNGFIFNEITVNDSTGNTVYSRSAQPVLITTSTGGYNQATTTTAGGNRYGWLTSQSSYPGNVEIDSLSLTKP